MKRASIRLISLVLALIVVLPMGLSAFASAYDEEEVTYTITFQAGRQGYFTGSVTITPSAGDAQISTISNGAGVTGIRVSGLKYGQRVAYDAAYGSMMQLIEPDKYYVKGVRKSGRDNNELVNANSILVDCDQEIVVAYGIQGDMVDYTVRYVDFDGKSLAPSRTYYGNVGDRPVVAYLYIDGYIPQAYNMIKTLQKDSANNIFTFVYKKVTTPVNNPGGGTAGQPTQPTEASQPTGTTETTAPTEETTVPTEETTAPTEETTVPTEETTVPTEPTETIYVPVPTAPAPPPVTEPLATEPPAPTEQRNWFRRFWESVFSTSDDPEELVDLDDWQVPLANAIKNATPAAKVAVSGVSAAAGIGGLALLALLLGRKKKKKDDGQGQEPQEKNE